MIFKIGSLLIGYSSETTKSKTTYYTYDGFGRLKETRYPDGNRQTQVLQWAGGSGPTGAIYYSYTQVSGSAPIMTWFDALGREIHKDTYGLNNLKISTSTEYYVSGANKGRLYRVSEPYFEGDAKTWAETYSVYDAYGRPTTVQTPMGNITTSYNGLSTTVTTPEGTKITTLNSSGFVESSTVNGKTVSYMYYPSGLTKTATPEGGQALLMEYNLQGKRTKLTDPDAGIIETKYNGFGELVEEKQKIHNASWIITTNDMESSTGRLNSINRNGEITSYTYDTYNRISKIEISGQHKQTFSYDDFDRVTNIREEVGSKIFNKETSYDALGRIKKEIFPSGYYTVNHYDANGYLTKITDKQSRLVWEAMEENARGQLTQEKKGTKITTYSYYERGLPSFISASGVLSTHYEFNEKGNLTYRDDYTQSYPQREMFAYDTQNRLTNWSANGMVYHYMTYNNTTGNIQSKSDIGNYTMNYGEENGKPHALTSISGVPANFPTNELNVTYTDFKKIKILTEGNKYYQLTYGIDDQRRMSIYKENNVSKETRYYLGDYEEKINHTSGITEKIHYLSGAIYIERSNGTSSFYYAYTDYLGSLIALTDESGTVVERYAYDPWGKRRNPANWTQDDPRTSWIIYRGYTMHEHLDQFGIINMNGRVYDPLTAMFFSPDPFVQAPDNWLNYNRYTYAYGNPFRYIDPSGEIVWFVPVIIGAVIGGVSGYMIGDAAGAKGWDMLGYIAGGALIGGLSGGAAAGVSALGGGAMLAGAAAGAVGGGGFSGLATGWNSEAMLKGAAFGAISGFVGGGLGSAIGGGWGALAGGVASNLTSQLLYNGGDFSSINWASVVASGAISFGLYHGMQYMQYKVMNGKLGQLDVTYKQFSKINAAYQRSRFWQKEYGVYLNKNGSARFVPPNDRHKLEVVFDDWKKGDFGTAHTHWAKEGTDVVIGSEIYTTVGGYHSHQDLNIPGYSLVVGRNSSTYSIGGTGVYNYINPDPFIRFFMFPWK